ncbi:MAG: hypothetical protein K2L18_06970 [Acetatifactor sp.]|nr:hypothetical protein [Acetatifactor sp.]
MTFEDVCGKIIMHDTRGLLGRYPAYGVNYDTRNANKLHSCVLEKLVYGFDHK